MSSPSPDTVSSSTLDRQKGSARIAKYGSPADIACDYCFDKEKLCIVMSSRSGRLTCSECRKRGRPCVSASWESVDRTVDETEASLEKDGEERDKLLSQLAELQARMARKRKVLEQARQRAMEQFWCLERELEQSGEPNLKQVVRDATLVESQLAESWPESFDDPFVGTLAAVPNTR